MLTIRKGKEKRRVFTFLECRKCEAIYAYVKEDIKEYVKIFKDEKIFDHVETCPNCGKFLRVADLYTDDMYEDMTKEIIVTETDNKTRVLTKDEIYVFI